MGYRVVAQPGSKAVEKMLMDRAESFDAGGRAVAGAIASDVLRIDPRGAAVSVYSNPKNSTSAVFNVADLAETALAVRKSEVLAIDARRTGSPQLLGTIADQIGRHDGAIEIILSTIALNNRAASYHSNLGTVFQAQGKLDEAEACYERALALKPGLAEARSNLGNILQAQGKLDEAVACYERALALKFELAETRSNLGNILQAQGKLDEAVACYERGTGP